MLRIEVFFMQTFKYSRESPVPISAIKIISEVVSSVITEAYRMWKFIPLGLMVRPLIPIGQFHGEFALPFAT